MRKSAIEGTPVRASIIGLGKWGAQYIELLLHNPLFELVSIYDENKDRCGYLTSKYGVKSQAFPEMLGDESIDTIFVLLPNHLHYEYASKAMKAGKNVFIEKPLSCDLAEAQHLYEISKAGGVLLYVGHSLKMVKPFRYLKDAVDKKIIGDVHQVLAVRSTNGLSSTGSTSWRRDTAITPLLPMIQLGIHLIDASNYLFQGLNVVAASATNIGSLTQSVSCILANESVSVSILTSYNTCNTFELELFGTEGKLVLRDNRLEMIKGSEKTIICKGYEQENSLLNELEEYYLWRTKDINPVNTPERALLNVKHFDEIRSILGVRT